jgi:hypothetical protein
MIKISLKKSDLFLCGTGIDPIFMKGVDFDKSNQPETFGIFPIVCSKAGSKHCC